jgi:hypothetical protein
LREAQQLQNRRIMRHAFASVLVLLSLLGANAFADTPATLNPELAHQRTEALLNELQRELPRSQTEPLAAAQAELRKDGYKGYDPKRGKLWLVSRDLDFSLDDYAGTLSISRPGMTVEYRREPNGKILRRVSTSGPRVFPGSRLRYRDERYLNDNGKLAWFGSLRWKKAEQALRAKR